MHVYMRLHKNNFTYLELCDLYMTSRFWDHRENYWTLQVTGEGRGGILNEQKRINYTIDSVEEKGGIDFTAGVNENYGS